mgnify:CR=1 FL=1
MKFPAPIVLGAALGLLVASLALASLSGVSVTPDQVEVQALTTDTEASFQLNVTTATNATVNLSGIPHVLWPEDFTENASISLTLAENQSALVNWTLNVSYYVSMGLSEATERIWWKANTSDEGYVCLLYTSPSPRDRG